MILIGDGGISSCNVADTMDAIMLSKNIEYLDGIKLDVRMSKDNILVVALSNELKDFTNSNKRINEENYDYLRKVKFSSHIFKYYIPTLEEVLKFYNHHKKILLELYSTNNDEIYLNKIFTLLKEYSYDYYFLSEEELLKNKIENSKLQEIGKILKKDDYQKVNDYQKTIKNKDIFIISQYSEKIHQHLLLFDMK